MSGSESTEAKPSKRDVEASRARLLSADERWQTCSDGAFPLSPHLFIDTSAARPTEVAERIMDHFDLHAARPASPSSALPVE